jgi:hypothetical protein
MRQDWLESRWPALLDPPIGDCKATGPCELEKASLNPVLKSEAVHKSVSHFSDATLSLAPYIVQILW